MQLSVPVVPLLSPHRVSHTDLVDISPAGLTCPQGQHHRISLLACAWTARMVWFTASHSSAGIIVI